MKSLWKSISSRSGRPFRKKIAAVNTDDEHGKYIKPQVKCRHELLIESKRYNTEDDELPLQSAPPELPKLPILPTLPTELWIEILEEVILTPQFAFDVEVDVENAPQTIEAFHTALSADPFKNPTLKACSRTRNSMRLVCKTWRDIADSVHNRRREREEDEPRGKTDGNNEMKESNSPWIKHFSIEKASSYGPCKRFDTLLPSFETHRQIDQRREQISVKYQHDVGVIRIQIRHWSHDNSYTSFVDPLTAPKLFSQGLSTMLMRPSTLRVLYISLNNLGHPMEFPIAMLQDLPSLRTLGIGADAPLTIDGKSESLGEFVHPTITTLILNIEMNSMIELEGWKFPSLHTFSDAEFRRFSSVGTNWIRCFH